MRFIIKSITHRARVPGLPFSLHQQNATLLSFFSWSDSYEWNAFSSLLLVAPDERELHIHLTCLLWEGSYFFHERATRRLVHAYETAMRLRWIKREQNAWQLGQDHRMNETLEKKKQQRKQKPGHANSSLLSLFFFQTFTKEWTQTTASASDTQNPKIPLWLPPVSSGLLIHFPGPSLPLAKK